MRNPQERHTTRAEAGSPERLSGTALQIVEAALRTLKAKGFAGASASVRNLLLAVLDLISERRMNEYGPAFELARSPRELATLARAIYADDLERGYITVLGEMVGGGVADAELGAEVAARIEPWVAMVERKIEQLFSDSPMGLLASPADLAFGLVALYFGVDMLSHLQADQSRAESLLDLGTRLAGLAESFLGSKRGEFP